MVMWPPHHEKFGWGSRHENISSGKKLAVCWGGWEYAIMRISAEGQGDGDDSTRVHKGLGWCRMYHL